MGEIIDITGQTFGRWVVHSLFGKKAGRRHMFWNCICECGNKGIIDGVSLRSGHSKSCGCLHNELVTARKKIELTGKIFGRWTIIKEYGREKRKYLWLAKCECGREGVFTAYSLMSGNSKSCGCLRTEQTVARSTTHGLANTVEYARTCNNKRRAHKLKSDGHYHASEINQLKEKQGNKCPYCRVSIKNKYHIDHIIPLSKGGSNYISNIMILCPKCNLKKGSKSPETWAQQKGFLFPLKPGTFALKELSNWGQG